MTGLLLLPALTACAGTDCEALPRLQTDREERRQSYLELARSGAPPEQTAEAEDALHAFERRVCDVEQQCADR